MDPLFERKSWVVVAQNGYMCFGGAVCLGCTAAVTTNVRDKMWARPVQMQDGCWLCKITSTCTFSRPKGPTQKKKFANVETFNMLVVL